MKVQAHDTVVLVRGIILDPNLLGLNREEGNTIST